MMQISVAMATFNGERFIGDQLASIAAQHRLPDQLVICDDASTDQTLAIAHQFARRAGFEVLILRNEQRLGYGENFFRAMKACTGDIVAFCDQDDVWHPDKLARCERLFEVKEDVSLVVHSAQVVDDSLRPQGWSNPDIRKGRILAPGSLRPLSCYIGSALVLRSCFIRHVDVDNRPYSFFLNSTHPVVHDNWANLVCGALGAVALLPESLMLYRRHASNTSQTGRVSQISRIQASLALQHEESAFRRASRTANGYRAYLETLRPSADELGCPARAGLERAIASHLRYGAAMERRASAYAEYGVLARGSRIAANAFRRDYSPRDSGGLGISSLARDLTVGFRRRPPIPADGHTSTG